MWPIENIFESWVGWWGMEGIYTHNRYSLWTLSVRVLIVGGQEGGPGCQNTREWGIRFPERSGLNQGWYSRI